MKNGVLSSVVSRPFGTASTLVALALAAAAGTSGCKKGSTQGAPSANSEEDKAFYALGVQVGQSLRTYNLKPAELATVKAGIDDGASGKEPKVDPSAYRSKVMEIQRARQQEVAAAEKVRGKEALDKAAAENGAEKLPSGMVYKVLNAGNGPTPVAEDTVKVNYEGRLVDGTVFDSSYKRNQPAEFPLRGVVKCWTDGLQKMAVGTKARLTCPSEVAYGERGKPPTIPGNATLVFDVELLEIVTKH